MPVLSRISWTSQQRVDLHHLLGMESFAAADFRAVASLITGLDKPYVARGFHVSGSSGLTVSLSVADSMVFNILDSSGSFYLGLSDDADLQITLPASQSNIFVEARFRNESRAPLNAGLWDPLATDGLSTTGQEFTAAIDTENALVVDITANTTGFSDDAIPLFRASTSSSSVTNFKDCRPMLFRLGTGGTTPDPLAKYGWSSTRSESVQDGTGVGELSASSPWRNRDTTGSINDKAFKSLKDVLDALMTRISEISGSPVWYLSGVTTSPIANLNLNLLYFDTLGHSIQASANAAFKWATNYKLIGHGTKTLNGTTSQYHEGLIQWQSNTTGLRWHLGGTFAAGKRNYTSSGLRFESPVAIDGGNIYMYLERDVPKGSGSNVLWGDNSSYGSFTAAVAVSGAAGDFTGIALGDYIRKESEGLNNYYKVVKFWDGSTLLNNATASQENTIATSSVIALEVESVTNPSATSLSPSSEPLRYFRSRYQSSDIVADSVSAQYTFQDANYYWLGRRTGTLLYLRDYGTMQPGEEATTLDNSKAEGQQGGAADITIQHAKEASYGFTGYALKTGAGNLLTIRRRKRDNTAGSPSDADNSYAMQTYTIANPVGSMSVGQKLWVRLNDDVTTSTALVSGSVVNSTDDETNTDAVSNVWQILDTDESPTRSYDNRDIYLIAQLLTINGVDALLFFDGSILTAFGMMLPTNVEVSGEMNLTDYTSTAIPFIGASSNQLSQAPTVFFYNNLTNVFGVGNFRIDSNPANSRIYLDVADDVTLFDNLGAHTATIGSSDSTIRIPGNLLVEGSTISASVENIQSDDKLVTLGVGNLNDEGFGAGIEVADDTQTVDGLVSYNTQTYIDIQLTGHGYVLGDVVGVSATADVGGITSGDIGGQYTIVAVASVAGEGQIIDANTVRIYTNGTATSNDSTVGGARTFVSPWSFRVGSAAGAYTGITSWVFRVKGQATAPAVTPVSTYGIVPTAHSTNFLATRIPFANNDNSGPAGVDSTLDLSADFTFDSTSKVMHIGGSIEYSILAGYPLAVPTSSELHQFAKGNVFYQYDYNQNVKTLTNIDAIPYEERVFITNDADPTTGFGTGTRSLPTDTKWLIGSDVPAEVLSAGTTLTVYATAHGMSTADTITVYASATIGGVSVAVTSQPIVVIDVDTFEYTIPAASIGSGRIDKIIQTNKARSYLVGNNELEIYLNGLKMVRGTHYNEIGTANTLSSTVSWIYSLAYDSVNTDIITYRISNQGGQLIVNNGGGGSLQTAYNLGASITTTMGNPVTISGTGTVLSVIGDLSVSGIII